MLIACLLAGGCIDPEAFDSDPDVDEGETVIVDVSSPVAFDSMWVLLPPSTQPYQIRQATAGGGVVTEFTYSDHSDTIGDAPRALAFEAKLAGNLVASGELPDITYTLTDDGQNRQSTAEVAITLTE